MTRQYYCWKVCLTFRCGCKQYAPTVHHCPLDREGCNNWQTNKQTDRDCEEHRNAGWGLNNSTTTTTTTTISSSSSSSMEETTIQQQDCHVEGGGEGGQGRGRRVVVVAGGEGGEGHDWEGSYARRRV